MKHYDYELGKADSLNIDMVFIFENENENDVTVCHLYDDRGFQIFYLNR